jgi:hypothetical protein
LPSEQEKMVTAKRAPIRLKQPLENRLDGISGAYASKFDGSAMWTAGEEEPDSGADHEHTSDFAALVAAGRARFGDGLE